MGRTADIAIAPAQTPEDMGAVRGLFEEYSEFMGFKPCFQGFDAELTGLPGAYAPPSGELLLCKVDDAPAGCVAFCRATPTTAEVKRLYVRPAFRGMKIGWNLARLAIGKAREAGYMSMTLETVPDLMPAADGMYRKLGFARTACRQGTDPRIVCYVRALGDLL